MQQRFSKAELQEQAAEIFGRLGTNVLFATSDGQFFEMENRAQGHAAGKMGVYRLEAEGNVIVTEGTEDNTGRQRLTYSDIKDTMLAAGLLQESGEAEGQPEGSEQTNETAGSAQAAGSAETGESDKTPAAPAGAPAHDQDPAKVAPAGPGLRRETPAKKSATKKAAGKPGK